MTRILIVTDAWYPQTNGVVRCLDATAKELTRRGFDVSLLTPEQFWTVPLPTYPEIRLSLTPPGAVAETIRMVAPDHLHIATEGPLGLQARLYAGEAGLAFTTSYHTRFPEYLAARVPVPAEWSYAFLRWFHGAASATMVPTPSVLKDLRRRGFKHLRLWSRGVDRTLFHPGDKTMFADLPAPHMLYVGRLAVEKNVEAFLRLDLPGSKIVVGDGPQAADLHRLYPQAHFLGALHGEMLAAAYRSADVFVFPSKTDTFGNVITEALASGVPVAAYPVTGPRDILGGTSAGALDADLENAVRQALTLSRADALAHAQYFTWTAATDQFVSHLVPVLPVDRRVAA